MRQFDVYRNPGQMARNMPYVLVVQSSQFTSFSRRAVIPLIGAEPRPKNQRVFPRFIVEEREVFLSTLEFSNVPATVLRDYVTSLSDHAATIIAAIDEVFSTAYD